MNEAGWRARLKAWLHRRGMAGSVLTFVSLFTLGSGAGFFTARSLPAAQPPTPERPAVFVEAPAPSGDSAVEVAVTPPAEARTGLSVLVITEGTIHRGETLARSLDGNGVSPATVHLIATEMRPVFDFRYARPGDTYRLAQNERGEVLRFRYTRSPLEHYTIRREGEGYLAARHEPKLIRKRARIAGVVASTLYEAIEALGEQAELANDFAEIFAWDVDFSRSVRPGDEFSILYERLLLEGEDGTETYVRPGRILAARYVNGIDDYRAVYFQQEEGRGGYYRPDGSSVERQILRAPLNYRRISSRFSHSRLHPILKVRRPHLGIDYAAAPGTPVWSVADGTVIFRGVSGALGRLVKVKHANGYVSYYGHLSRFPAGMQVGQRVRQKEVVGYVGASGRVTGPHLHYQLMRYGRYVDPAQLRTPAGDPIPPGAQPLFANLRDELLEELDPTAMSVVTNEAL